MTTYRKRIVIVGDGAAGLEFAARLGWRYGRKRYDILLVARDRMHIWAPLLHHVAASSVDANIDVVGYRSHCHRLGYSYVHGTLESVDTTARKVRIAPLLDEDGSELIAVHDLGYDLLVLAFGSLTNNFRTQGAPDCAIFHQFLNRARWSSLAVANRLRGSFAKSS